MANQSWTSSNVLRSAIAVLLGLVAWEVASQFSAPWFLPSPLATLRALIALTRSGDLPSAIGISYFRILSGWAIGCLIGIPLAIAASRLPVIDHFTEPFVNFFRFIPPIAFLGIAILWFGIGEASKIAIIVYTATFTTYVNTLAGARSIDQHLVRAAQCLGANSRQIMTKVVLPATVPSMLTGMRIGMGFSFMTVVAAELIAAKNGVGFLIYNARLFMETDQAFAGIFALGMMGILADLVFKRAARMIWPKHQLA